MKDAKQYSKGNMEILQITINISKQLKRTGDLFVCSVENVTMPRSKNSQFM